MSQLCAHSFIFNDTATPEIYSLSLHDALPICGRARRLTRQSRKPGGDSKPPRRPASRRATSTVVRSSRYGPTISTPTGSPPRSEEHTSELKSRQYLVCRLLLEKKKAISRNA